MYVYYTKCSLGSYCHHHTAIRLVNSYRQVRVFQMLFITEYFRCCTKLTSTYWTNVDVADKRQFDGFSSRGTVSFYHVPCIMASAFFGPLGNICQHHLTIYFKPPTYSAYRGTLLWEYIAWLILCFCAHSLLLPARLTSHLMKSQSMCLICDFHNRFKCFSVQKTADFRVSLPSLMTIVSTVHILYIFTRTSFMTYRIDTSKNTTKLL